MKYSILFTFLLSSIRVVFSQIPKPEDLVHIPQSPEAHAFTRYGNVPANLYTGTVDVSVPIPSVRGRDIEVPIALSYDASGIKVEQIATWVGLGWNLNFGGMISRQINGLPDDYLTASPQYVPFYNTQINSDYEFVRGFTPMENSIYAPGLLSRYFNFLRKVTRTETNEKYEIQPDTYSLSAMGISGTIFIDYVNNTAYCVEHPDFKITPQFQNQANTKLIIGWVVIDAMGTVYTFASPERTKVVDNDGGTDTNRTYNSAWMLATVKTANDRDIVQFNYTSMPYWEQEQLAGRGMVYNDFTKAGNCGSDVLLVNISPTYSISQMQLSSVIVNGKRRAELRAKTPRLDLLGKKMLDTLVLYDGMEQVSSQHVFRHTYLGTGTNEKEIRLKLDGVDNYGSQWKDPQKYDFFYYEGLPSRESMSQDFWGYYNGRQATTLIPYNYEFDIENVGFKGADRTPNDATTRAGTMYKMVYPTRGATYFGYSPHTLSSESYSYQEEVTVGTAGLLGGRDDNDPLHSRQCDDASPVPPKGIEMTFEVKEDKEYKFRISLTGAQSGPNNYYVIAIYFAGIHEGKRTFCDISNNGNTLYYVPGNYSVASSTDLILNLPKGFYGITILNAAPQMTVNVEVITTQTITGKNSRGAGLRIQSIRDTDHTGKEVLSRYFYYGDLKQDVKGSLNLGFVTTPSDATVGQLHARPSFEEARAFQNETPSGQILNCSSLYRSGSSRSQSNYFITYPVVSEITFDKNGKQSGFTVMEFENTIEEWTQVYAKHYVLNGKLKRKSVYDSSLRLQLQETNYHSQTTIAPGEVGFYFSAEGATLNDIYVKSDVQTPSMEFYSAEPAQLSGTPGGWQATHCASNGIVSYPFSDIGYHKSIDPDWATKSISHTGQSCNTNAILGLPFNDNHPARVTYQSLAGSTITHANTSGMVFVNYKKYNIIFCNFFGANYVKRQYINSRYLIRLDSTVTTNYFADGSFTTWVKNSYDTTTHYQVVRVRSLDSEGKINSTRYDYAHTMRSENPAASIWSDMIAANRISEPIRTRQYTNDETRLLTTVSTIYRKLGLQIVADRMQYATGNLPLKDRIIFYTYDANVNPVELARANDFRIAVQYGYNATVPVAEVKNAALSQIYFNSFEEGPADFIDDAHTGKKSKNGFSYTIDNLTAGTYVLSYWQKSSGNWILNSSTVPVTGTSFQINISGQVDDIRFHPAGAQMSTYTYGQAMAVSSITDANNNTVYFSHDDKGRLINQKDNDLNVVKTFKYHIIN